MSQPVETTEPSKERMIIHVDVGQIPSHMELEYLERIKTAFMKNVSVDEA